MGEQARHPQENIESQMNGNGDENENSDEEMGDSEENISQEEFEALSNQMDQLNEVLDNIEEKNENIYSELLKLLQSNREVREQLRTITPPKNGPEEEKAQS